MAEHAGGYGAGQGHGKEPHAHGSMDVTEHQRMFEAFMKFWVYVFGASALILIFLALFNS